MDHVDSVLESDADDVVLSEVSRDRGHALPDQVRLVGLHDKGNVSFVALREARVTARRTL